MSQADGCLNAEADLWVAERLLQKQFAFLYLPAFMFLFNTHTLFKNNMVEYCGLMVYETVRSCSWLTSIEKGKIRKQMFLHVRVRISLCV
jgi:hypothetical protein